MASKCPEHVNVVELQKLIDKQPDPAKDYMTHRWLHQVRWWECRAWGARRKYFLTRSIVIVGGVLIPFLADVPPWRRIEWQSLVALLVAASAGLEALFNWGAIWLEKRKATELLKGEGFLFMERSGVYSTAEDPFSTFVANVENKIAAEVGEYVSLARPEQPGPPRPNERRPPENPPTI
jgi:hypothetical protein